MSSWLEEYSAALDVRDEREKANIATYNAYTRLADRTSKLENHAAAASSSPLSGSQQTGSPTPQPGVSRKPSGKIQTQQPDLSNALSAARRDLVAAQKSRTELSDQLSETTEKFEKLKKKYITDRQKFADLAVERTQLQVRMKDQDEELRGKAKLLDDVQGELVSLNLQFNMAEERSAKLARENKELVDRWMARVGQEAEAMNRASKFS
ncbi:hypothetical protein FQN57_007496 [Myotisia sp. PD_48]|nr:hypothetical protein FQN57_007496 [Myotisia sp. PD_48]